VSVALHDNLELMGVMMVVPARFENVAFQLCKDFSGDIVGSLVHFYVI
jgi:hypothetical protein